MLTPVYVAKFVDEFENEYFAIVENECGETNIDDEAEAKEFAKVTAARNNMFFVAVEKVVFN